LLWHVLVHAGTIIRELFCALLKLQLWFRCSSLVTWSMSWWQTSLFASVRYIITVVLAKHEIAPWWWFLHELKHVGATVGILIVLIFLWFYICVHQVGRIKRAFILLMHGTNMKKTELLFNITIVTAVEHNNPLLHLSIMLHDSVLLWTIIRQRIHI
jgi:hypothetical protein